MNFNFLDKLKDKIFSFNIFEIGNSVIFYHLLIFYFVPFTALFGLSTKIMFVDYKIPWLALGYAALGLLAFIVGYFIRLGSYFAGKTPNIFVGAWNQKRVKIAFWAFFVIGTINRIIRIIGGGYFTAYNVDPLFSNSFFYGLVGYLDWFWYIALIIAFINYYKLKKENRDYKKWKLLAFGVLAIEIFYGAPTCSRIAIIIPVLLYLLIKSLVLKIKYLQIGFVAIAMVLVLFPFGNICRNFSLLNSYQILDFSSANSQKQINYSNIKIENVGGFIVDNFWGRINQSFIFSKVLDAPRAITASYGSSLSNFLSTLGPPKFLWPNKPLSTNSLGNDIGHRLGILSSNDFETSIGPTLIGDLYMVFGILGIILGMFFMGVFFRFIYDYLIKLTDISSSGLMIYSVFWVQVIQGMENWVAPIWAGLIKYFVLLVIVHLFLVIKKD